MRLGVEWAAANLDFRIEVPTHPPTEALVVMNGNEALGMGALASGMELCAMYPITPATSVSHYLAEVFSKFGGILHQAEDEIAAVGVAIDDTRAFLSAVFDGTRAVKEAGGTPAEAYRSTHAALEPRYGSFPIFEHTMPFNVQRAWDELDGIDHPRIWTVERDRQVWDALTG